MANGAPRRNNWKELSYWITETIKRLNENVVELFEKVNTAVTALALIDKRIDSLEKYKQDIERILSVDDVEKLKKDLEELKAFSQKFEGSRVIVYALIALVAQVTVTIFAAIVLKKFFGI